MTHHGHAVVWIDHRMAKIFEFSRDDAEKRTVNHLHASKQIRRKAASTGSGHIEEDSRYLKEIATALSDLPAILIVGPGHAKWQLRAYLNVHAPKIAQGVAAVLHADHPSDGQIVEHARKYFLRVDRMTPQRLCQSG